MVDISIHYLLCSYYIPTCIFCIFVNRPVETEGLGGIQLLRFLLKPIFDELKKNSVTVKNSTKLQMVETPQSFLIFITLLLTLTPEMVSCQ